MGVRARRRFGKVGVAGGPYFESLLRCILLWWVYPARSSAAVVGRGRFKPKILLGIDSLLAAPQVEQCGPLLGRLAYPALRFTSGAILSVVVTGTILAGGPCQDVGSHIAVLQWPMPVAVCADVGSHVYGLNDLCLSGVLVVVDVVRAVALGVRVPLRGSATSRRLAWPDRPHAMLCRNGATF